MRRLELFFAAYQLSEARFGERGVSRRLSPPFLRLGLSLLYQGAMLLVALRDPRNQSVGDRVANTLVVRDGPRART